MITIILSLQKFINFKMNVATCLWSYLNQLVIFLWQNWQRMADTWQVYSIFPSPTSCLFWDYYICRSFMRSGKRISLVTNQPCVLERGSWAKVAHESCSSQSSLTVFVGVVALCYQQSATTPANNVKIMLWW